MNRPTGDAEARLQALRAEYARQLPERIAQLHRLWGELKREGCTPRALERLRHPLHDLSGSGTTFGHPRLSRIAHALEGLLGDIARHAATPDPELCAQVEAHLQALERLASLPPQPAVAPPPPPPESRADNRTLFLLDEDRDECRELVSQVRHYGYRITQFADVAELCRALVQGSPGAVVLDISRREAYRRHCLAAGIAPAPLIFLADRGDLPLRIEAVRSGGNAFFTRPLDINAVVDELDRLTRDHEAQRYRILIVEDSAILARYYATCLEEAGMLTSVIHSPAQLLPQMEEFQPELILLDMYMPDYSGPELAAAIRQRREFVGIPIVFLSAETDRDIQLEAMGVGGDDFLTKPIMPEHLISAVRSRARRARVLRSFMVRDSLTGLYNHTRIKEALENEVRRALRDDTPLAFAMLDIDHFKRVNDRYGHAAGDRVIRSLSHLLQQRLRRTDIIGRYGGEEFAVILPGTDGPTAVEVLDALRAGFSQLHHHADGQAFTVTFSGGIATLPPYADPVKLGERADTALYRAKETGRNRLALDPIAATPADAD